MKKLRKWFLAILSLFVIAGVALGFSKAKLKEVNAASSAVYTYKTYSYEDYQLKADFKTWTKNNIK